MANSYSRVVLIETAGNQRTIFQTNRLRENIGASQLIHRVGTEIVPQARRGRDVRPIVEASGKAILLTRRDGDAKAIIEEVTRRTLLECPGVVARGTIVEIDDWTTGRLNAAIAAAHRRQADLAAALPAPVARFQGLPFVESCLASGYPATKPDPDPNLRGAVSEVGLAKRRARDAAWKRIGGHLKGIPMFKRMEEFEADELDSDWVGIVHADGNGLGEVFLNFAEHLPEATRADPGVYCDTQAALSAAVDDWSREAARAAILATWPEAGRRDGPREVWKRTRHARTRVARVPIIPVVLGGDDLTVICEGERAVRFAARYLEAFEKRSRAALQGELGEKLPRLKAQGAIAAAAGVAIVKPHFPFHRAYGLAEQLTKSAKVAKQAVKSAPCSALDFQVLFGTSGADLEPIRERMRGPAGERLTMRPYVVTPLAELEGKAEKAECDWARRRHYREGDRPLRRAVEAVLRKGDDRDEDSPAHLPRSQAHALHDALYQGRAIADGRLRQVAHRYRFDWESIAARADDGARSLFVRDGTETDDDGKEKERWGAYLLDAMELADLGGKEALDAEDEGAPRK